MIRKTRKRHEIPQQARFLTFSCFQRLPLLENDAIKDVLVEQISLTRHKLEFKLYAWVIMPEHVHLIIEPGDPKRPIPRILSAIKRPFAAMVLARWRQMNAPILSRLADSRDELHFWQAGGGYDRNLFSRQEFFEKIDYCHANPVARGLAKSPVDWRWSSAAWYAGRRDGAVEIDPMNW